MTFDYNNKKMKVSDLQPEVEEEIKQGRKNLRKSINEDFSL